MNNLEVIILPYLFLILFGFILLNLIMNLCLYSFSKVPNIKMLCWYWGGLLLTFLFQGLFQEGQLPIILSYGSNVIPTVIMSIILFDTMSKKAPLTFYFGAWILGILVTPILHYSNFSFTIVALPLSIAMSLIPIRTAYELLLKQDYKTSHLQKLMGCMIGLASLHFINFALFRMGSGNQLWGWAAAMGLYQIFSVLLFALVLENQARKENSRLQEQVEIKTKELNKTLKIKESLFHMVLHDIATPIQSQILICDLLEKDKVTLESKKALITRFGALSHIIKNVIDQVRSIEAMNSAKMQVKLTPVNLEMCLQEILTIFENQLTEKNITFNVVNDLSEGTLFFADRTIFTTSVLGNLISNAIKFSLPNTTLKLHSYEKKDKVFIEVMDQGIGMSEEITFNLFSPNRSVSRLGTNGEIGTGFGMAQVKTYVDHFGGEIDIKSWPMETNPENHGTRVTLTLDKSLSYLQ